MPEMHPGTCGSQEKSGSHTASPFKLYIYCIGQLSMNTNNKHR